MNSNVKTANRNILAYAAAICLAGVLVTFNAHAGEQPPSETVKFGDLDLGTQAGAEALYKRIHRAASHVCVQPAGELAGARRCMEQAENNAIGKVNSPLLTAFYEKTTGRYPQTVTASR
jgi:UrcA family protein